MLQKQFFKYVLPSMLSFAFTGVYAIVDGWFLGKNKAYYSLAICREHGLLRGKIRFKKTDEDRIYVVKTIRPVTADQV